MKDYNFYENRIRKIYVDGNVNSLAIINREIYESNFLTDYQKKNLLYISNACINYLLIEKAGN